MIRKDLIQPELRLHGHCIRCVLMQALMCKGCGESGGVTDLVLEHLKTKLVQLLMSFWQIFHGDISAKRSTSQHLYVTTAL